MVYNVFFYSTFSRGKGKKRNGFQPKKNGFAKKNKKKIKEQMKNENHRKKWIMCECAVTQLPRK